MFRLDVLRHGAAAPAGVGGDRERRLTAEGAEAIDVLGRRLAAAGWRPDAVWSSPYPRALETARLVQACVPDCPAPEALDELVPDGDVNTVATALARRSTQATHVLVVGHQPLLGNLVQLWTGRAVSLQPGGFVALEFPGAPAPQTAKVLTFPD